MKKLVTSGLGKISLNKMGCVHIICVHRFLNAISETMLEGF